jgi:hypothetical protein
MKAWRGAGYESNEAEAIPANARHCQARQGQIDQRRILLHSMSTPRRKPECSMQRKGTMNLLDQLDPPRSKDVVARLQWATERMWDLAEGRIDPPVAGLLWALVVGWADLCDENERRQYLTIAGQIEEMLSQLRGD